MLTTFLATIDQAWAMEGRGNSVEQFSVATILATAGISITTSNAIQGYASARDDALVYVAALEASMVRNWSKHCATTAMHTPSPR